MIPGVWSVTVTRNSCHMIQMTQCPHTHKQKIKTSPQNNTTAQHAWTNLVKELQNITHYSELSMTENL